jgi:hypothetical protein
MKGLTSILFSLLFSTISLAEPLQIAQDPWPPFVDETAKGYGLSIEVVQAALEPKGYQFQIILDKYIK